MEPNETFKEFLRLISPILRERGFTRDGQYFFLRRGDNWGLVNFQKSWSSTRERIKFTVNVGTVSGALRRLFPEGWYKAKPRIGECHWEVRLGHLLPARADTWWVVDADTSAEELAQEFRGYLTEIVVPAIEAHIRDESLRDLWLTGRGYRISKQWRLAYLAALLKLLGPRELLDPIVDEIQRQPFSPVLDWVQELLPTLPSQY